MAACFDTQYVKTEKDISTNVKGTALTGTTPAAARISGIASGYLGPGRGSEVRFKMKLGKSCVSRGHCGRGSGLIQEATLTGKSTSKFNGDVYKSPPRCQSRESALYGW